MKRSVLLLGGIIVDHYLLVDHFPLQGQDTMIHESFYRVGGCAINVAATLQNLGCEAYVVATVGDDHWGNEIERYLQEHGFKKECVHHCQNQMTGFSISIVEKSGERTFLTFRGCEEQFSADMIPPAILERSGYVYVTGYYLLNPDYHREILSFLEDVKGKGLKVLFDPGPLVGKIRPEMTLSLLKLSDVVTPNQAEIAQLGHLFQQESPVNWMLQLGVQWVVEKRGSHGVIAKSKHRQITMPAYPVKSVDTTGAGDSFAGGLLYGLVQGYPFENSLRLASACGALTTQIMGPHGTYTLEDVNQLMDRAGGILS